MLTQAENDLPKSALGSSGWRGQLANESPSPWVHGSDYHRHCFCVTGHRMTKLSLQLPLFPWKLDADAFFFFSVIASSEPSQDTHIWLALSGSMPILPHSLFSQETGEQIFHFSRLQNETQENWILNWCGADLLNAYIPELDTKHYATCMKCDLTGHLTSSSFVYSSNIIIFLISLFRENTVSFDGNFSKLRDWLSTEQEQEDECLLYSSSIVSSCQVQLLCLNKEQRVCKTCSVY